MLRARRTSPLSGELRDRTLSIARETAARLRDRDRIEEAARTATRQTGYPKSVHWQPAGIAQGFAGVALMHAHLARCFPSEDWAERARSFLQLAAWDADGPMRPAAGLFSGLAGIAFVGDYLDGSSGNYGFVAAVERELLPEAERLAGLCAHSADGLSPAAFDAISGVSGIGAYLVLRIEDAACGAALEKVLSAITWLSQETDGIPRWRTPAHLVMDETMQRHYPYGNLNCGLAHGVPGMLALLALALREGAEVDGMADAIRRIGEWLLANRCDDEWGVNWPSAVALRPAAGSGSQRLEAAPAIEAPFGASRAAWCYGAPGLARALWIAGQAVGEAAFQETAIAAMEAVYRRPVKQRNIDAATFCHGVAGLLQITIDFGSDTDLPVFHDAARALTQQIVSMYEPQSIFGFQNLEPGNRLVDQPGLLDGAPGVVLALLSAAIDETPSWDRLFLLS
jgi:hypothetical protein